MCGCSHKMWSLWLSQNQGDRVFQYHLPITLQGMAEARAEDNLLKSDTAQAVEIAGRQARVQPSPYPNSGQGSLSDDNLF